MAAARLLFPLPTFAKASSAHARLISKKRSARSRYSCFPVACYSRPINIQGKATSQ